MMKDISKRYLHAIYFYNAYRYKDSCQKIDKMQILRNCFARDICRCVILITSDRLYNVSMKIIKKIKGE